MVSGQNDRNNYFGDDTGPGRHPASMVSGQNDRNNRDRQPIVIDQLKASMVSGQNDRNNVWKDPQAQAIRTPQWCPAKMTGITSWHENPARSRAARLNGVRPK